MRVWRVVNTAAIVPPSYISPCIPPRLFLVSRSKMSRKGRDPLGDAPSPSIRSFLGAGRDAVTITVIVRVTLTQSQLQSQSQPHSHNHEVIAQVSPTRSRVYPTLATTLGERSIEALPHHSLHLPPISPSLGSMTIST